MTITSFQLKLDTIVGVIRIQLFCRLLKATIHRVKQDLSEVGLLRHVKVAQVVIIVP